MLQLDSTAISCYLFLRYYSQVGSLSISDIIKQKRPQNKTETRVANKKNPYYFVNMITLTVLAC